MFLNHLKNILDCQTFGSLIGPLTNHGTSIIALISEYRQRVEQNNNEEDKKKLRLLEDRLKMVCASQSRQINLISLFMQRCMSIMW